MTQKMQSAIPIYWADNYEKLLQKALVIGNVANKEFKGALQKGDELVINVLPDVTYSSWTGGDLSAVETLSSSSVSIKITKGGQIHFKVTAADEQQMVNNPQYIKEVTMRGIYQFANAIDTDLGLLYADAGINFNSGTSVEIDESNPFHVLAECNRLMDVANLPKQGRFAILPPTFAMFLMLQQKPYIAALESTKKEAYENGLIAKKIAGFDEIYVSNNVYNSSGTYYPIFGMKNECIASIVQKDMKIIEYMPDLSINNAYKGGGMYGVKAYRTDKLGKMTVTFAPLFTS
ncbi:MAG: hypothetical protein RLY43_1361 [Bacteroidota bacterium]